jgi:hypothetical protein
MVFGLVKSDKWDTHPMSFRCAKHRSINYRPISWLMKRSGIRQNFPHIRNSGEFHYGQIGQLFLEQCQANLTNACPVEGIETVAFF